MDEFDIMLPDGAASARDLARPHQNAKRGARGGGGGGDGDGWTCAECGTAETTQRRCNNTLCNACGLRARRAKLARACAHEIRIGGRDARAPAGVF